jgi:hypothetical protein
MSGNDPFDLENGKPDLETGIPQDLEGELDITFVDQDEPAPAPQAQARRGQNEDAGQDDGDDFGDERPDRDAELRTERLQSIDREEQMALHALNVEARRIATERESAKVAIEAVDSKISMLTEALKAAKADGDTSAEVDFLQALSDARTLRGNIVTAAGQLPTEDQLRAQGQQWIAENISARRQQVQAARQAPIAPAQGNDLAARYIQHNAWMNTNAQARQYAVTASQMLAADGIDPKSPQHFVELSRRVAAKFPSLGVRSAEGRAVGGGSSTPAGQPRPQTAHVASARGAAPSPTQSSQSSNARRGTVTLSGRDNAIMKKMGLDPSNKQVQQRYAKEKLARIQEEGRR